MAVVAVCAALAFVDSYMYGTWSLPPLSFLRTNLWQGYAALFGTQPAHWYLTNGLPVMLGLYAPLLLYSLCRIPTSGHFK